MGRVERRLRRRALRIRFEIHSTSRTLARSGRAGAVAAVCCMCLVWSTSPAPRESAVEGRFAFSGQVQGTNQIPVPPARRHSLQVYSKFCLVLGSREGQTFYKKLKKKKKKKKKSTCGESPA